MNSEERRKREEKTEAYFASIAHLKGYFDLKKVRPFFLGPDTIAQVDKLLSRHKIPIKEPYEVFDTDGKDWRTPANFRADMHWLFGYIGIQYNVDFEKDQENWRKEREFYRKPETNDGIWQYVTLGQGHIKSKEIEKITITYKNTRQKATVIAYPYLIDFILQAIEDKYRATPDEDQDESELKIQINDDFWNVEKYTEHEWGTHDYLTFRKKETIEQIYYYLHHNTQLGTQALCRFGAELMFEAGVPFTYKDKSPHDVFTDELTQYFKKYAPIQKKYPKSDAPSKMELFLKKYESPDNQSEL
jgi:hypothetical protein